MAHSTLSFCFTDRGLPLSLASTVSQGVAMNLIPVFHRAPKG
jgi:hypothetical protein